VLRRLWALLWLPAQLRRAWEQRFPVLAEIRRINTSAFWLVVKSTISGATPAPCCCGPG
jgi:hypothetical protein